MTERSRTEYSIVNIAASMGGYALNIILSFICRIVFAHQLSADYLGVNGLFGNILSMLSLTELGIGTAMIYALYRPVAQKDEKKIASYMRVYGTAYKAIGCVVGILGIALFPVLKFIINEPPNIHENIYFLYVLFLFSTASSYFFSYRCSIFMANQRNYIVVAMNYMVVIVQNIAQIIALVLTHNYIVYLVLQVVFTFLSNALISRKAVKDYPYITDKEAPKLEKAEIWDLVKNIKALTVTKLSGILVNNTDNIVITYFKGLIATGLVSNYALLINMLTSLVTQVFTSITASVGNLNAVGDEEQKYSIFNTLNLANFWIYGWVFVGIIVLVNDVIAFCFGKNYIMPETIPIILAINFYMLGMQNIVGIYKSTMGLFKYGQYILLSTAVLNLIGDVVLGKQYGILGIFVATAVARLFTNTWYEPYVIFKHGFKRKFKEYILKYAWFAISLIIATIATYMLCQLVKMTLFVQIIIKGIICILVPNLIFIAMMHRMPEFKALLELVQRVLQKIKGLLHIA